MNGDGSVTSKELQSGIETMIKDWKSLKKSWTGHKAVSRAYHISTLVLYVVLGIALWMAVFNVSYKTVLLPFVSALSTHCLHTVQGCVLPVIIAVAL